MFQYSASTDKRQLRLDHPCLVPSSEEERRLVVDEIYYTLVCEHSGMVDIYRYTVSFHGTILQELVSVEVKGAQWVRVRSVNNSYLGNTLTSLQMFNHTSYVYIYTLHWIHALCHLLNTEPYKKTYVKLRHLHELHVPKTCGSYSKGV